MRRQSTPIQAGSARDHPLQSAVHPAALIRQVDGRSVHAAIMTQRRARRSVCKLAAFSSRQEWPGMRIRAVAPVTVSSIESSPSLDPAVSSIEFISTLTSRDSPVMGWGFFLGISTYRYLNQRDRKPVLIASFQEPVPEHAGSAEKSGEDWVFIASC